MSELYPEYPLTNFPERVDSQHVYEDVGIETVDDMNLYYQYINAKNFTAAKQLLIDKPQLKKCIIDAIAMNTMEHKILAIQKFYFDDVQKYIMNLIASDQGGITIVRY